jgi:hypothetical protein
MVLAMHNGGYQTEDNIPGATRANEGKVLCSEPG